MIDDKPSFGRLRAFAAAVCVIGAGPVGIATARALRDGGLSVLLLESGGRAPGPAQDLARAENLRPDNHHAPELTTARRLGGTSNLWGGRCLPFDPVDFRARPWLGLPAWPIGPDELDPFLAPACAAMGAGPPIFAAPLDGVAADDAFGWESLERWNAVQRVQDIHGPALARDPGLLVALGATVLGFGYDEAGRIARIVLHLEGEGRGEVAASRVILAAGGNESTRLLLAEARARPGLFGGKDGPLGRFYMGHVNGQIADIVFDSQALHDGLGFFRDAGGTYVRRRLVPAPAVQEAHRLANTAFWPVVPAIHDAAHRSGPLSAVWLALSMPGIGGRLIAEAIRLKHLGPEPRRRLPHIANVLRAPLATLGFGPRFLWANKIARPRLPGLFLTNPARRYGLEYHAEHLPDPESRLTLGDETDRLGLPRLRIDLRFGAADAASVLRAHAALEDWLRRNRLGRLAYRVPESGREAAVLAEARHGTHQIGTIRMAAARSEGVVDATCTAFDVPNLHVVSTAVLPTSGQANPTLTAVQLGLRLADRLAREEGARRGLARAVP